jgi:hypothetical protein
MPGVITSVKPVFRKPTEPDPRLARLANKIKQVRHAQALRLRRSIGAQPLSHVFDGQENHSWYAVNLVQPPGVEQHRAPPNVRKVLRDFEVVEKAVPRQNVLE